MKRALSFLLSIVMLFSVISAVDLSALAANVNVTNRAEWLTELVKTFNMTVESDKYPDNYFSDLTEDSKYYQDVLIATEFGLVNVKAGEPVEPNGKITREFAAQTLNFCLGFELDKESLDFEYSFSDYEECMYPDDDQIAVNRGWFDLDENGNFHPDVEVDSSEITIMISDANSVLGKDKINENYDSEYIFSDYVVEVQKGTDITIDEYDTVRIQNSPVAISVGDTFVVYINDLPSVFFADSVSVIDNVTIITTSEADVESAVVSIDAQEITEVDATRIKPVDGLEIDQSQVTPFGRQKSATVTDNSVTLNGQVDVGGVKIGLSAVISNISVQTKLDTFRDEYSAVVAFDAALSTDLSVKLINQDITLGKINILGIGSVDLSINVNIDGKASIVQKYKSEVGFAFSISNGLRNISSFTKDEFSVLLQVSGSVGLKLSASINVLILKAEIFGTIGLKIDVKSVSQMNETPCRCDTIQAYMYANAGYNFTINLLLFKYEKSATWDFLTIENSSVRLYYHFEDGLMVDKCTAGGTVNYVTPNTSSYATVDTEYYQKQYTASKFDYTISGGKAIINGLANGYNPIDLVIPSTIYDYPVVTIGNYSFYKYTQLKSVTIPNSVTSIGSGAFSSCTSLASVTLGNSVISIGDSAFYGCKSLESITIGSAVTSIGSYAFFNVNSTDLYYTGSVSDWCKIVFEDMYAYPNRTATNFYIQGTMEITKDVIEIPDYAFMNCKSLKSISIPDSVTDIGWHAFRNCEYLTSVTIPDSVTNIGNAAFYNCTSLTSAKISNSVTSIGSNAFSSCRSLASVTIGNSVTSIGNSAFFECERLTSIDIPDSVTSIGDSAFNYCTNLTDITIGNGITSIKSDAFYNTGYWNNENNWENDVLYIDNCLIRSQQNLTGVYEIRVGTKLIADSAFSGDRLTSVNIPNSVINIGDCAFLQCIKLTNITIPDSVRNIGEFAFSDCTNLANAKLSKNLTSISYSAFSGCSALLSIDIPNSITSIGKYAFDGCTSLTNIAIPDSVTNIDMHAFGVGLTSIEVDTNNPNYCSMNGVLFNKEKTELIQYPFYNSRTCYSIPDNVTTIFDNAFSVAENLTSVIMPNSIKNIYPYAFLSCKNLDDIYYGGSEDDWNKLITHEYGYSIYLPSNVTVHFNYTPKSDFIYELLDDGTVSITGYIGAESDVTIPSIIDNYTVTVIGDDAFSGFIDLTSVTIPYSITSIGSKAFFNCDMLKSAELSKNVESIGDYTFAECDSLQNITILNPNCTFSDFSIVGNMDIEGYRNSTAHTYAKAHSINFIPIETTDMLKISTVSLSLESSITMNFKVLKSAVADFENPYVVFNCEGDELTVTDYTEQGDYYVFSYPGISPQLMNDNVKAVLHATHNGIDYTSPEKVMSVRTYAYTMLERYNTDSYAKLRTLLVDLLNYGAASQKYIGYQTDKLVNADLTDEQKAWGTSTAPTFENIRNYDYKTIENPTSKWVGSGLVLNNSVMVRAKFTAGSIENKTVVITCGKGRFTYSKDDFVKDKDGSYYVYCNEIFANEMSEEILLTVYDNGIPSSNTMRFSIESYAKLVHDSYAGKALDELTTAMMRYGNSAKAYGA